MKPSAACVAVKDVVEPSLDASLMMSVISLLLLPMVAAIWDPAASKDIPESMTVDAMDLTPLATSPTALPPIADMTPNPIPPMRVFCRPPTLPEIWSNVDDICDPSAESIAFKL